MKVKTVTQVGFAEIFNFATEKYGIHWNPCNDIFFGNSLDYHSVTDWQVGDWQGYTGPLKDEMSEDANASEFTKEEVLAMKDIDKSYVILDAYFESLGVTGEVQIDCR